MISLIQYIYSEEEISKRIRLKYAREQRECCGDISSPSLEGPAKLQDRTCTDCAINRVVI